MAKAAASRNEIGIKYADKSAGQPELVPIFNAIKKMLASYKKGSLKMRGGSGGQVALVSEKPVVIGGRKKEEVLFASALVQKGYVGFYYMPIYESSTIRQLIRPELLKCLKGKACFYIKKQDAVLMGQIKEALEIGFEAYKKMGWI